MHRTRALKICWCLGFLILFAHAPDMLEIPAIAQNRSRHAAVVTCLSDGWMGAGSVEHVDVIKQDASSM